MFQVQLSKPCCMYKAKAHAQVLLNMLQNRTSARASIPNNQPVFNAYGRYPMLVAAPGQVITMTWPRTAPPDGTAADGSEFLNVYYNPNATINAGMCKSHNTSKSCP